eukprot:jgi/Botrbrau1/3390/Bobra.0337s0031.1
MMEATSHAVLPVLWKALSTIFVCTVVIWLFKFAALIFDVWKREILLRSSAIPRGPSQKELVASAEETSPRKWARWEKQWGQIFYIRILHKHAVIISDPALVAQTLRDGTTFDKSNFGYQAIDLMTSSEGHTSLLTHATDDYWRLIRKGIMPAFSAANMKRFYPAMQRLHARLVKYLKTKSPRRW